MPPVDLRAGYAARTLPVPVGTPLGGYQPTRDSTGTHDPLEINLLVLDDGARRLILALVDLVCVNRDLSEAVRATIRADSTVPVDVWVGASHTHAGPDVGCRPGGGRTPSHWLAEVTRLAADCHHEAARHLTPSGIRYAEVPLHGLGSIRADPTAPHRVSADLIHWPGADGILAVVPVHSTVLPRSNTLVGGDLHAAVRRHLRNSFDGWVAVAPGCAGNVSTRWTRRAQDHDECDRLAGAAAGQLLAALPTARRVADDHTPLGRVAGTVLTLPARVDDPDELAAEADSDADPATLGSGPARLAETHRQGLDLARARALDPVESVDLSLGSARVGDLLLTAVGAEPYLGLRDRLRTAHGPATVALGYTGGYAGYLPDAAAHATPGYEVLASPFRPEAEEQALAALAELSEDASDTIPSSEGEPPVSHPEVNQQRAAEIMQHAITDLLDTQQEAIATAAGLVAESLQAGGIIQVSGTGHSKSFAMEVAGRAGGLVPANAIGINDLILYGGEAPESLLAAETERDPTLARRILDLAEIHPADVFLIASSSGGNGSVVELARLVKERGHLLIAITSMDHTSKITSRHPSGQRLFELADVVIDNRAVFGDAALDLPGGGAIAATSTVTSVMIAQMLVTEVCGLLLEAGTEVPVYVSANVPGGDDHNNALRERYAGRVRFGAP